MKTAKKRKTVLTIAGSDCSGGAGIQADIKTLTVHGVYAMSAITAMTAQNTAGVYDMQESTPHFLEKQLECIFQDIFPDAVKIGMVCNQELINVISGILKKYHPAHIVLDPIILSTSGANLLQKNSIEVLKKELFPLASLVTPNISEAAELTGMEIKNFVDREICAAKLSKAFGCSVLIKGGHSRNSADDLLYHQEDYIWYHGARLNNPNTHGTGCTLSAAIAANLAMGQTMAESVRKAKQYLTQAIQANLKLGSGSGPLDHLAGWQAEGEQ